MMRTFKPISRRLGRIGLAFAALVSIAAVAGPAAANDWGHHRHHDGGFFSFGFSSPGYYYAPPPAYYSAPPPGYYYAPPPPAYYYPPPAYYYPPPAYYAPGASFNFVIPFGGHHHHY